MIVTWESQHSISLPGRLNSLASLVILNVVKDLAYGSQKILHYVQDDTAVAFIINIRS